MTTTKILIICPFPVGVAAGQRLKYEQYFDHWRLHGYEVTVSPFMDMAMWRVVYTHGNLIKKVIGTLFGYVRRIRDLFRLSHYDVVYIHMWVTPLGTSLFERAFGYLSKYILYDIEDNVYNQKSNDRNPLIRFLKGRAKTMFLIRESDHVITSSPALNDYCMKLNKSDSCTYISSSVDTDRFVPVNKYSNDDAVTIGWTGTFSSKEYLDLLSEVLKELAERCVFKLRVIGNFTYELAGVDLEVIQWTEENEVYDLQGIDIGIYPLSQDEWVSGKSGLKAIQYMAFGLPTVATNVGTTPRIISHLENGWLVKTDAEWLAALETLISDSRLRKKLGIAARETVVGNYSTSVIKKQYLSILNNCKDSENE